MKTNRKILVPNPFASLIRLPEWKRVSSRKKIKYRKYILSVNRMYKNGIIDDITLFVKPLEEMLDYQKLFFKSLTELAEIEQIAGKALDFPWYKDDQKNFPGSTEADGVCTGCHTAASIVEELANTYTNIKARSDFLIKKDNL